MNQFTLLVVVVVVFCYFGGKYCPSALKKNKELLLGVAGGLVLCSFFGLRLEGFKCSQLDENNRCVDEGQDFEEVDHCRNALVMTDPTGLRRADAAKAKPCEEARKGENCAVMRREYERLAGPGGEPAVQNTIRNVMKLSGCDPP